MGMKTIQNKLQIAKTKLMLVGKGSNSEPLLENYFRKEYSKQM